MEGGEWALSLLDVAARFVLFAARACAGGLHLPLPACCSWPEICWGHVSVPCVCCECHVCPHKQPEWWDGCCPCWWVGAKQGRKSRARSDDFFQTLLLAACHTLPHPQTCATLKSQGPPSRWSGTMNGWRGQHPMRGSQSCLIT
ncbi:MAG: hypothetical protein J3K34DRAFT_400014 [Monoraphidium minutum]|nr:MAG: hypothetical protein J3K34DRAFT_400014 [Monoraphidium minutum]